jgi:hypothetical protein
MCEPEVFKMLDEVGNCLISCAYEVKACARDIGNLKYWADSAREHKGGGQNSKECSDFSFA